MLKNYKYKTNKILLNKNDSNYSQSNRKNGFNETYIHI